MISGIPTKVTIVSCHDNFTIITTNPMILTVLLKKILIFRLRVSLMVVVSDVSLEVMSPVQTSKISITHLSLDISDKNFDPAFNVQMSSQCSTRI